MTKTKYGSTSPRSDLTHSISSFHNKEDIGDSPCLKDLSAKDRSWDKHRRNSDVIAEYYRKTPEFEHYAERIDRCSQFLDFLLVPEGQEYRFKLINTKFCRVRYCAVCQWRRSLAWKARGYQILPKVVEDYPKHRWLFLTLTVKNCQITELKDTLSWLNKSWQRMTQRKKFPAIGFIRSTEITRGKDGSAHPHFHCLLLVKPSYFGKNYLKQVEWAELWRSSLKIDYFPVVDIRPIKTERNPVEIIPEILKYCVKESDLIEDADWFIELTRQMRSLRTISTGGVLKKYLHELEKEPEDLILKKGDRAETNEGHIFFRWRYKDKMYRLLDL